MELEYDPFEVEATKATTSAERAVTQDQFRDLLDAADEFEPVMDLQAKMLLYATGRLGLRVGELVHMRESWLNREEGWISIPEHQPCQRGRDGGICGACHQSAKQMAETNDMPLEQAEQLYWKAKTVRAARDVPYTFHDGCAEILTRFFDEFDRFTLSAGSVARNCNKIAEKAGMDSDEVTAHGLRATAAMYHVDSGMDMWGLQSLMGWAYPNTARRYILSNSRRTKKLLEERHENSDR
jgi:integrase